MDDVIWRLCGAVYLHPKWIKQYMRLLSYNIGNRFWHMSMKWWKQLIFLYFVSATVINDDQTVIVMEWLEYVVPNAYSRSLLRRWVRPTRSGALELRRDWSLPRVDWWLMTFHSLMAYIEQMAVIHNLNTSFKASCMRLACWAATEAFGCRGSKTPSRPQHSFHICATTLLTTEKVCS